MKALLLAGVNVARFNFSHGSHEEQLSRIQSMRQASRDTGIPVALLLDTKGPEIRTGSAPEPYSVKTGEKVTVSTEDLPCSSKLISISYQELPKDIIPGNHILIADGLIDLEVISSDGKTRIETIVRNGGTLGSKKNVNVPGVRTRLPAITEKDKDDILFGIQHGMDYIAASFVRKPSDILEIQAILDEHQSPIRIIAKIEDQEGLENIDEIIRVSYGIMVARGDLGVQLRGEEIPLVQKRLIEKCNRQNKPVITATQMLDSMINNPQPTRAETNDVANAVLDGTDAVMLSGETANGAYPVKAVETMANIAFTIERSEEYRKKNRRQFFESDLEHHEIGMAVARAAHLLAEDIEAEAMVTPTLRGNTARLISKFRPSYKIIAATVSETVQRQLLLHWGVYPVLTAYVRDSEMMIQNALKIALGTGLIKMLDKVVTAAGIPLNNPMMMNSIKVHFIGTILGRGSSGFGSLRAGKIVKAKNPKEAELLMGLFPQPILLCPTLDESFKELLPRLRGLIVESNIEFSRKELQTLNPELVVVSGVAEAVQSFESGQYVSIDGDAMTIYEGLIRPDHLPE